MSTLILLSSYLISLAALVVFIVALIRGWFDTDGNGAKVIFAENEIGRTEDPAASPAARRSLQSAAGAATDPAADADELGARAAADESSRLLTFVFFGCSVLWLLVASVAGLVASI